MGERERVCVFVAEREREFGVNKEKCLVERVSMRVARTHGMLKIRFFYMHRINVRSDRKRGCVCVCVCVWKRARKRVRKRERVCVWNRVRKRVYAEEHGKDEESDRVSAGERWRMERESGKDGDSRRGRDGGQREKERE